MTRKLNQRACRRRLTRIAAMVACALTLPALTGCPLLGLPGSTAFSTAEFVPVAAGTTVEATLGAGASRLADSTWALYRASDDTLLFRIEFGSNGEVVRLFDSFVFAQPWLGSEIVANGQAHPTAFTGGSYVSGAYVAESGDDVGVLGVIHGLLWGAHLGTATLSFSGPVVGDRIDGPMQRTVTTFADTPFPAPGDAAFDAYALRES